LPHRGPGGDESHLAWLRAEVLAAIQRGSDRSAIQQTNLIPPGLLAGEAGRARALSGDARERDQPRLSPDRGLLATGPAGNGLHRRSDRGSMLVDYLGVTESRLSQGVERMIADGRYELAASALDWARGRYPRAPVWSPWSALLT